MTHHLMSVQQGERQRSTCGGVRCTGTKDSGLKRLMNILPGRGGAMILGELSVPLDNSGTRAYCAFSRCGRGLFGHFFSRLSLLFSFSLSLGDGPMKTGILSQRDNSLNTDQTWPDRISNLYNLTI